MTVTRSTRASARLSGQPSNDVEATPTKRKSMRERTPKTSRAKESTPRSRRKVETKAERQQEPKRIPGSEQEQETAEVGLYFTDTTMFNTPSRKPVSQSAPKSTTEHPKNPVSKPARPSKPSPAEVEVIKELAPVPETQALYDRIAAQGIAARSRQTQSVPDEEVTAVLLEDKRIEERTAIVPAGAPETPKRSGWGWGFTPLKSVLNFFTPSKPSPHAVQPPATAPPAVVLAPEEEKEIHEALTPAPQPRRKAPQTAKPKSRTQTKAAATKKTKAKRAPDSLIVSRALESIDPRHHDKAREWVEQAALRFAEQASGKLGEKRKRFESGLRVADIEEIPSHYPWEKGGAFGLLDEFDDSDDEAPAWYVLDRLANNRPIKRRKATHDTIMDEDIPSLNDLANRRSPPSAKQTSLLFDSHGNSAQLNDLHPRSAILPSPMFASPVVHQPNGNVFKESVASATDVTDDPVEEFGRLYAKQKNNPTNNNSTYEKELKRTGHVSGSGSFCVPEGDSDSDEDEEVETGNSDISDPSWLKRPAQQPDTLQPPPPPIPAHATLPSPIKASPVVPPIQRETSPVREDPVKIQRALAMKHTPAKPSRLREAMLPSPSLLSDAGNESLIALHDPNAIILKDDDGMPQYMPLDIDMDIQEYVSNLVESDSFKKGIATAWGGSDVILRYDEEDEL